MNRSEKYIERTASKVFKSLFSKSNIVIISGDTKLSSMVVAELKQKSTEEKKIKITKQNEKTIYNHKIETIWDHDISEVLYLGSKYIDVVFIEKADVVYKDGDINIALDALKKKGVKIVLTSSKGKKEIASLLKNRVMKTIEVNYLEEKTSKRTAANKEAIEAFDALETFDNEIPFPDVENKHVYHTKNVQDVADTYRQLKIISDDLTEENSYLKSQLQDEVEISDLGRSLLEEADEVIKELKAEIHKLKEKVSNESMDSFRLSMLNHLNESDSILYKKECNYLKDEIEALMFRIDTLENEKKEIDETCNYVVRENMDLQSEIISLERKIKESEDEHENKLCKVLVELEALIKKNKER